MKTRIGCPFDPEEGCPNTLTVWWQPEVKSRGFYDPSEPSFVEDVSGCPTHLIDGFDARLVEEALEDVEHDKYLDAQENKYDEWRDRDV